MVQILACKHTYAHLHLQTQVTRVFDFGIFFLFVLIGELRKLFFVAHMISFKKLCSALLIDVVNCRKSSYIIYAIFKLKLFLMDG